MEIIFQQQPMVFPNLSLRLKKKGLHESLKSTLILALSCLPAYLVFFLLQLLNLGRELLDFTLILGHAGLHLGDIILHHLQILC